MKYKIVILVVILLVSSGFINKKKSEVVVISNMEQVSKSIGVVVEVHKVWSKVKGIGQVEVFVDYTANNYLRLVSMYRVKQGQVVSSERVSP